MRAETATGINRELLLAEANLKALLQDKSEYLRGSSSALEKASIHTYPIGKTERPLFQSEPYSPRALLGGPRNNRCDKLAALLPIVGFSLLGSVLFSWLRKSLENV